MRALLAALVMIGCSRTTSALTDRPDGRVEETVLFQDVLRQDLVPQQTDAGVPPFRDVQAVGSDVRDVQVWYDCFGGYAFPPDADITDPPPLEEWPRLTCGGPDVWMSRVCCPESEVYDNAPRDDMLDGVRCTSPRNCRLTWQE